MVKFMGNRAKSIAAVVCLAACMLVAFVVLRPRDPSTPALTDREREHVVRRSGEFTGSSVCRECHERFYELWATSHHGLAMQPFTRELAEAKLTESKESITIRGRQYSVNISSEQLL
jgi:hypothetical protein